MKSLNQVFTALRRNNRRQYVLLISCSLFSVMLITAFATMMQSPTVLSVLPEGGDSRKQVMAIFALAVVGCGVFTAYAASLFFRYKSRQTGVLMALGATRKQISAQLFSELGAISVGSCLAGALLGIPLAWGVWQLFRIFLVDTDSMKFQFSPMAYLIAGAFTLYTVVTFLILGARFINRTNIIDIVNEQRKSEPVRDLKPWYGYVGIGLILAGGIAGYSVPSICITVFHWYPPAWINILYLPLLVGVYMVLLHTVVRGWGRRKNHYKNIITHSMMKFQGRQTVRNMLVITLLLAGAYFATFYAPMLGTGNSLETEKRPYDYFFHYRADQDMVGQPEIEALAEEHKVSISDWKEDSFATLACDGQNMVEDPGDRYHYEYAPLLNEVSVISESVYNKITGQQADVQPGHYSPVINEDGSNQTRVSDEITKLTNMTTGQAFDTSFQDYLGYDMMATKYYVVDDSDYAAMTQNLAPDWMERLIVFNVADVEASYPFAKDLTNQIISRSNKDCEVISYYDRIQQYVSEQQGETYWGDTEVMTKISYDNPDSADFKNYWKYAPKFRVMDQNDFVKNFAVFLMLFVFIAIICFAAVLVIAYTRCLSIAMNNRQVYDDLKHLGAGHSYLYRSVRGQISKVYFVPAAVGTIMMYGLYAMIMYANDGMFTQSELMGLGNCLLLILGLSAVIWIFYKFTLKKVCCLLNIKKA